MAEETHFELATRRTIEQDIIDFNNAGDLTQVDAKLGIWPSGHERPEISLELARHIARNGVDGVLTGKYDRIKRKAA